MSKNLMNKDYASILKEQIEKRKDENPLVKLEDIRNTADLLFSVINDMLNERDPRLTDEISDILEEAYLRNPNTKTFERYYLWSGEIRSFLEGKTIPFMVGREPLVMKLYNKYGINVIRGEDALKKVYGKFDRLSGIRSPDSTLTHKITKAGIILFKSLQNLDDFIRKNTEKQKIVIINWKYNPPREE